MKNPIVLLLAPLLVAGCAGRSLEPSDDTPPDFGLARDFATSHLSDLSTGDLPGFDGCTLIPTWSSDDGVFAINQDPGASQDFAWNDYLEGFRSGNYPDGGSDILFYEFDLPIMESPPGVPHMLDLTNPNESLGLVLDYPFNGTGNGSDFFATSGNVTVTAIDDTQPTGNIAVHGDNVVLQQTDDSGDIVPNGACVQLGSFDLSAMYDNQ